MTSASFDIANVKYEGFFETIMKNVPVPIKIFSTGNRLGIIYKIIALEK